ncbi:MAG: MgtC/SapB family protein [Anaerolineae bacterium]|nr:MgtC/SapB family protein [Anaerolineae bacterium]MDW8300805.1 MgtC/SapB family protein [Anaerolineae bacterium]
MDFEAIIQQILQVIVPILQQIGQALEPIVGTLDVVLISRLLIVIVLCGMIGLERSEHERASGFRPHILVGLGACLMTMAGAYALPNAPIRDPMRVASYVVSGIGFLGAGAILRHGTTVRGLTTAASIWGSAGIGIATGVGLGALAAVATLLILFTLTTLERLEARLGRGESANDLKIHLRDDHKAVGKALTALDRLGVPVKRATMLPGVGETAVLRVELSRPLKAEQMQQVMRQLLVVKAITRVDVAALEVEDAEELAQEMATATGENQQQAEQLSPTDVQLLKDLNEPEPQEAAPAPKPRVSRQYRRMLYRRRS